MDMVAVTTGAFWDENAAISAEANDAVPKPRESKGVESLMNQGETTMQQPVPVTESVATTTQLVPTLSPESVVTTTMPNGADNTPVSAIPTTIIGGNGSTTTQQTGLQTIVNSGTPTTQASFVPAAASSSQSGNNLSNGAIAGIAIAALILGASLSFLAAFLLFKRRTNTSNNTQSRSGPASYTTYADSTPELVMLQKSAGRNSPYVQVSQTPLPAPTPIPQPQSTLNFLPSPAHDSDIANRIQNTWNAIHRHIDTYYRDVHASITPSMSAALSSFGAQDVDMAALLSECTSPTTALRHALTGYVVGITGPGGDEGVWPGELDSTTLQNGSGGDAQLATARTLHRRLAVYIYTASSQRTSQSASAMREAAEHFSLTFFPWANPGADDTEKDDDLMHVIAQALEMRIWLFGQPGEFVFRWDSVGTRGVVVCPEVVRVDDGNDERERVVLENRVVGV